MKLAQKVLEQYNVNEMTDDEIAQKINKDIIVKSFKEFAEKFNELQDSVVKINVRDEDIKKEWNKIESSIDRIMKIFNKKYSK